MLIMRKIFFPVFLFLFGMAFFFETSCYYDNAESLYGKGADCDTTDVKYSTKISTLISQNCVSCHSLSGVQSTQPLETYDEVKVYALSGRIKIRTNDTLSPMP